jgi:hypothetical protein
MVCYAAPCGRRRPLIETTTPQLWMALAQALEYNDSKTTERGAVLPVNGVVVLAAMVTASFVSVSPLLRALWHYTMESILHSSVKVDLLFAPTTHLLICILMHPCIHCIWPAHASMSCCHLPLSSPGHNHTEGPSAHSLSLLFSLFILLLFLSFAHAQEVPFFILSGPFPSFLVHNACKRNLGSRSRSFSCRQEGGEYCVACATACVSLLHLNVARPFGLADLFSTLSDTTTAHATPQSFGRKFPSGIPVWAELPNGLEDPRPVVTVLGCRLQVQKGPTHSNAPAKNVNPPYYRH